jgi:hypothetical protein
VGAVDEPGHHGLCREVDDGAARADHERRRDEAPQREYARRGGEAHGGHDRQP